MTSPGEVMKTAHETVARNNQEIRRLLCGVGIGSVRRGRGTAEYPLRGSGYPSMHSARSGNGEREWSGGVYGRIHDSLRKQPSPVKNPVKHDIVIPISQYLKRSSAQYTPVYQSRPHLSYRLKYYESGDDGLSDHISLYYCPVEGIPSTVQITVLAGHRMHKVLSLTPYDLSDPPDGTNGVGWTNIITHAELGSAPLTLRVHVD
eukprot:TRINITY_DN31320_c0_g1_i1.p1 TRINITY_DN31320_c0_g1~~TRINITY_DN31320_c0_g1_i1.p1  ORF type:complete len:222 (+),score=9.88 TRINITY_DN31320_c0_g1_i1:56-667(+)